MYKFEKTCSGFILYSNMDVLMMKKKQLADISDKHLYIYAWNKIQ